MPNAGPRNRTARGCTSEDPTRAAGRSTETARTGLVPKHPFAISRYHDISPASYIALLNLRRLFVSAALSLSEGPQTLASNTGPTRFWRDNTSSHHTLRAGRRGRASFAPGTPNPSRIGRLSELSKINHGDVRSVDEQARRRGHAHSNKRFKRTST